METATFSEKTVISSSTSNNIKRRIKKVAVLGSGVMGSRIACHYANIGLDVLLLDIVPNDAKELKDKKKRERKSEYELLYLEFLIVLIYL
jgi:3-hydroxyisobutyrate dehydrogenase-like beta-hydroxyacid dehydrogenase